MQETRFDCAGEWAWVFGWAPILPTGLSLFFDTAFAEMLRYVFIFDSASQNGSSKIALRHPCLVRPLRPLDFCFQNCRYAPIIGSAVCVNAPLDVYNVVRSGAL